MGPSDPPDIHISPSDRSVILSKARPLSLLDSHKWSSLERLIKFVKQKVTEKHNIKLDLELKIIGEEKKND